MSTEEARAGLLTDGKEGEVELGLALGSAYLLCMIS